MSGLSSVRHNGGRVGSIGGKKRVLGEKTSRALKWGDVAVSGNELEFAIGTALDAGYSIQFRFTKDHSALCVQVWSPDGEGTDYAGSPEKLRAILEQVTKELG